MLRSSQLFIDVLTRLLANPRQSLYNRGNRDAWFAYRKQRRFETRSLVLLRALHWLHDWQHGLVSIPVDDLKIPVYPWWVARWEARHSMTAMCLPSPTGLSSWYILLLYTSLAYIYLFYNILLLCA